MSSKITLRELLEHPDVNSHLDSDALPTIEESLINQAHNSDSIYVRILIGIGAWVSAAFFVGGIGAIFASCEETTFLVFGIALIIAGTIFAMGAKSLFRIQVSLALVFAGNILAVIATTQLFHSQETFSAVISQLLICVVLYRFFDNNVYRFISSGAVGILTFIWLYDNNIHYLVHILIGVEMILLGMLYLREKYSPELVPLKYSVAILLPGTILLMNMLGRRIFFMDKHQTYYLPSSIILTAGLLFLFYYLSGGKKRLREPWMILAIVATILLGIFTNPGIIAAIGLLTLGYAKNDKLLEGLSFLFLPCFLVLFYYNMEVELAYKSAVIAGSGILLLLVRWLVTLTKPEEVAG